jgi:uncharacterized phage protein gp47/JayE
VTTIPTISQLYNDVLADLQTEYGVTISAFGRVWLRAFAAVQAGKLKLYYLAIAFVQKNVFPDTAESEATGGTLERFGRVKIGRNPYPATQGVYDAQVTGTIAATIPAQTTFKSNDDSKTPGQLYILDNAHVMASATDTILLRALTAGSAAQLAVGDGLTATAPIIGVDAAATVSAEDTAPADAETTEQYRAKVLQSFRLYPQGGASADYRIWGLEAGGVKQIYPYAASGSPGEINVFVEANINDSDDGMGSAGAGILADVAAHIEADQTTGAGRRPLGVFAVNVASVVVDEVVVTVTGASSISTANQALITAALEDAVNAVRPFIGGADTASEKNDVFGVNHIISTILSTLPGAQFTSVSMTVDSGSGPVNTSSRTFDNGNIPFLTSVVYA